MPIMGVEDRMTRRESPPWDPAFGARHATLAVAITVIVLALPTLFRTAGIVIFYLTWLPFLFHKGRLVPTPSPSVFLVFLLPLLALLSISWSDYPEVSTRGALEFCSLALCVVVAARRVRSRDFIVGALLGASVATLIGIAVAVSTGMNELGSKNQLGFVASVCLIFAMLHALPSPERHGFPLSTLVGASIGFVALALSHSAGALVSVVVVTAALGLILIPRNFSPSTRFGAVIAVTIFALMIGAIASAVVGGEQGILALLGKDATLTGRTYLWDEGIKNGMKSPLVGYGYSAFWVPGRPQAEKYWFQFGIYNRSGFHFHNGYIELFVELGVIGLLAFLLFIAVSVIRSFKLALNERSGKKAILCFSLSILFLTRSFFEVDVLGPFGLAAFLCYSILPRLEYTKRKTVDQGHPQTLPSEPMLKDA